MKARTYTAARENLADTMQRVCEDHAPVVITRRRDQAVVMMALDDYAALEETAYLLRRPRNAKRLRDAVGPLRQGKGTETPGVRMKIVFADRGWEDFTDWVANDRQMAARIVRIIKDIECEPFEGLGQPEPLRHDLTGFWSRRITDEHRLVYAVDKERVLISQARYYY